MSFFSVRKLALLVGFLLTVFAGLASAENYICVEITLDACTTWAVDSSVRLPPLSTDDAVSLSTKIFLLWSTCWVWVKLQSLL